MHQPAIKVSAMLSVFFLTLIIIMIINTYSMNHWLYIGGFHGKSTLLEALQNGVYNKIPGDGREFVVVEESTMKVRAEDGRQVSQVDISPFIQNLPQGRDTTSFSSRDASGSTSQASNIVEVSESQLNFANRQNIGFLLFFLAWYNIREWFDLLIHSFVFLETKTKQ